MNVFFRKDYSKPGPGIDPNAPEKKGILRFFEILQLECMTLVKLNLIFIISCIPVITIPPAIFAMNQVIRKMMLDQPVLCFYDFRTAFKNYLKRAYIAFFLVASMLIISGIGLYFYLKLAQENFLFFIPFMFCSTIFLITLLSSTYLYGILGTDIKIFQAIHMAFMLGIGKPLRAILAVLSYYGLLFFAILAFPFSAMYLLFIGFSVPCLIGNFYLRTVLKQYCNF